MFSKQTTSTRLVLTKINGEKRKIKDLHNSDNNDYIAKNLNKSTKNILWILMMFVIEYCWKEIPRDVD